ncbi:MAG: hypothetical protein CMI73_03895 [Candidatus Pelagibacter sp.]|nr:hypothetical protein [Candidatus Pelagibacter sp.]OUV86977.1 MAG: hypothetical protein CBC96_03825 [Pelagibacteraceae bacterium TMED136]|tara:strand:- start:664 stop:972 length:309 start_codon:yes stop_codon:yes gene_type:complete
MNIFRKLTILCLFFFINQCNYVDKEISGSQNKEKKILEEYLGKKSSSLKSKLGEPSKIIFASPYKIYVYKKSQLIITCERRFYINPKKDIIEKFDSQNCINK